MAQIVPLDAITPQPHVSIGKKLMDLSDAADARKLQQQTMAANKLKIDAATKEAQQNTAYDQSIALGGTDADQIKRAQTIGAGPYADALKRQKDNEQADALRQKTEHEAFGQFVDSTRKLLEPIYAPDTAESDRPLIYHHILNTIKSTGSRYAALLPVDFDPTMLKQFEDAKLQNDMAIKASDEKIKLAKEERDKLESAQKLENDKLTGQKIKSEIDNASTTPSMKEFNDFVNNEYIPSKGIRKQDLNTQSEANLRLEARPVWEAFKTNPTEYSQKLNDYNNHPELVKQFGAGPTGFGKYLQSQQIEVAAAGRAATVAANNPGSTEDNVRYITDQIENDPTGQEFTKLVGSDKKLKEQVVTELRKRDSDLRILTPATRQLGETAHTLMPDFDHALSILQDDKVKQAMGPVGSRWQDFLAGKIGTSDPSLRGIDVETIKKMNDLRTFVSLLQTGTMRAHVGARGSVGMQSKFENLFNSNKMDAATLQDTMSSTKEFLKGYENAVFKTSLPDGAGKTIDKATAQKFYKAAGNDPVKAKAMAEKNHWIVQ